MPSTLLKHALDMKEQIIHHRRYLHAHAETGFQLKETCAYVRKTLEVLGYTAEPTGTCGLVATIGSGEPVVLLRADMDALPIEEASGLSFAGGNGKAHACGHDMHTAMLLGAAALLKKCSAMLKGTVKLMFQPAEETLSGAKDMLKHGLLKDPEPKAALMLHVMNARDLKPGTIVVPPEGVSAPAADMFEIIVNGKGCHGAMPHMGIDCINAACHIILALQSISTREVGLGQPHALTISSFQAGEGTNVMPHEAILGGSVRSFDLETQQFLKERIEAITVKTAETFRAGAHVRWLGGCPPLVNHPELIRQMPALLQKALGEEMVLSSAQLSGSNARSVGSEDFSYISQEIPSAMLAIAAGGINEHPLHHPAIIFHEDALPYGAVAYAAFALSAGSDAG